MTAKERFELPFDVNVAGWETEPFTATAKTEFSLISEQGAVFLPFKAGETVKNCTFGKREYSDKNRWVVRFIFWGFEFKLPAPDFFKLFDA